MTGITSADVAREGGVSRTTVSYVLTGREGVTVSEETRRRVRETAVRLGYAWPADRRLEGFARDRLLGVQRTPAELGLADPIVRPVALEATAAATSVRAWREQRVGGVTAYDDDVALAGLRAEGLSCPGDMAVVGVDDVPAFVATGVVPVGAGEVAAMAAVPEPVTRSTAAPRAAARRARPVLVGWGIIMRGGSSPSRWSRTRRVVNCVTGGQESASSEAGEVKDGGEDGCLR